MIADGDVAVVRRERLGVRAQDASDVRRVLDRGVEVDVVADVDRKVHRHRVARLRAFGDGGALVGRCCVAQQVLQARAHRTPRLEAFAEEVVERRRAQQRVGVEHAVVHETVEVDHLVLERDGRVLAPVGPVRGVGDDAERQVVEPVVARVDHVKMPSSRRSLTGSSKLQLPNETQRSRAAPTCSASTRTSRHATCVGVDDERARLVLADDVGDARRIEHAGVQRDARDEQVEEAVRHRAAGDAVRSAHRMVQARGGLPRHVVRVRRDDEGGEVFDRRASRRRPGRRSGPSRRR